MEAELAAGLNLKNISDSKNYQKGERVISTLPFSRGLGPSVLFSIEIQVPLSAATEITRGGRRFGFKKQTFNVCFAPESGRKWLCRGMSAFDPKRTLSPYISMENLEVRAGRGIGSFRCGTEVDPHGYGTSLRNQPQ